MQQLLRSTLLTSLVLGAATASQAAPIPYTITGGQILVTASANGAFLTDLVALPANGETLVVDLAPGLEAIPSFSLTAIGPIEVGLAQDANGYERLRIDALSVSGSGTLFPIGLVGSEFEYFALLEDVVLDASFALVDDTLPDEPGVLAIPLGAGTGSLFADVSGDTLSVSGFAVGDFLLPRLDRTISIKTDFSFTAVRTPEVAIPEPTSAVVFAAGLLPIAGALRRSRAKRS